MICGEYVITLDIISLYSFLIFISLSISSLPSVINCAYNTPPITVIKELAIATSYFLSINAPTNATTTAVSNVSESLTGASDPYVAVAGAYG